MKKKTKNDVSGRDFKRAPPIGVFSDNLVTTAMMTAEMITFIKKYILLS
jgi:hypothetical protein